MKDIGKHSDPAARTGRVELRKAPAQSTRGQQDRGKDKGKGGVLSEHRRLTRFLIDPRTSKYIGSWDGITSVALVFTALCTPYEVAYVPEPQSAAEGWFVINRLVDVIFICDFVLQFFVMYLEPPTLEQAARWVQDHRKIALHYLRSPWCALDLLTILVSMFDYIALANAADAKASGTSNLGAFKALRVLRALRLIKLLRLLRGSRILKRWEVRVAINYAMLEMVTLLGKIIFASHLFA
jgi:hypothetical protein